MFPRRGMSINVMVDFGALSSDSFDGRCAAGGVLSSLFVGMLQSLNSYTRVPMLWSFLFI